MHGAVIEQINSATGDTPTTTKEIYTWNQKSGQGASSSGTIYGIYDLSGGVWERTAAYTANDHNNLTTFGNSLLYKGSKTDETSTKYTTVYAHNADEESKNNLDTASSENYKLEANKRKFGNAMHETSTTGVGSTSWRGDYSCFVGLFNPFSVHGGVWYDGSNAGLFSFLYSDGTSHYVVRLPCGLGWCVAL